MRIKQKNLWNMFASAQAENKVGTGHETATSGRF